MLQIAFLIRSSFGSALFAGLLLASTAIATIW